MIRAYDEVLISRSKDSLGRMLDFMVHSLHHDINAAIRIFVASGVASDFELGDIRLICGMSGIELAYEVLDRSGLAYERTTPRHTRSLSSEYWYGYTLALVQWHTCLGFETLMRDLDPSGLISGYGKQRLSLLESLPFDISESDKITQLRINGEEYAESICAEFTERPGAKEQNKDPAHVAPLKKMRIKNGLSQSELAKVSGIPVRTIQQYEQGQKDLSKARAEYLVTLARVLNCDPASLL